MFNVTIYFKGDLSDILPTDKKGEIHQVTISGKRSAKDLIESFGIPHTEVGNVLVNERAVDLSYILQAGDRLEVYPAAVRTYRSADSTAEPGTGEVRLLCDEHLRKLCRRLRLLGFDAAINREWDDSQLADISEKEGRILLTRDRGLLMRKKVTRGLLIRSTDSDEQVREVLDRLCLRNRCRPFSRCLLCAGLLRKIEPGGEDFEKIRRQIPEKVLSRCHEYNTCLTCGQVYWKGSHYKKLLEKVKAYPDT
jgi:hypothetical protein